MAEPRKRALVLGCGGVLGAAWMIAALAELERALRWDARSADVFVGTSAGAVLAALLGSGVSVERMLKSQLGELEDACWSHDEGFGAVPSFQPSVQLAAPALIVGALRGRVHPVAALAGALPRGRADLRPLARLIDRVVPAGAWAPHGATWIVVLDARTGQRVVLGRAGAPPVALSTAVCASFAIPGRYAPVRVNGASYIDAGIVSPASADALMSGSVQEVIVLAPMAGGSRRLALSVPGALRRYMARVLDREVGALRAAGMRVVRLAPGAEEVAVMGGDMMDAARRRRVLVTALRTSPTAVSDALRDAGS